MLAAVNPWCFQPDAEIQPRLPKVVPAYPVKAEPYPGGNLSAEDQKVWDTVTEIRNRFSYLRDSHQEAAESFADTLRWSKVSIQVIHALGTDSEAQAMSKKMVRLEDEIKKANAAVDKAVDIATQDGLGGREIFDFWNMKAYQAVAKKVDDQFAQAEKNMAEAQKILEECRGMFAPQGKPEQNALMRSPITMTLAYTLENMAVIRALRNGRAESSSKELEDFDAALHRKQHICNFPGQAYGLVRDFNDQNTMIVDAKPTDKRMEVTLRQGRKWVFGFSDWYCGKAHDLTIADAEGNAERIKIGLDPSGQRAVSIQYQRYNPDFKTDTILYHNVAVTLDPDHPESRPAISVDACKCNDGKRERIPWSP